MAIIRTRIIVEADGRVSLAEPVPAGEYAAEITPVDQPRAEGMDWSVFPTLDLGPYGNDCDRGTIYGDDRS